MTTIAPVSADMTARDRAMNELAARIEDLIYIGGDVSDIAESIVDSLRSVYSTPGARLSAAESLAFELEYRMRGKEKIEIPTRDVGFAG